NQTITYTWTATDECGNSTEHTQKITIVPAPKIAFTNLPTDQNVSCGNIPESVKTLETTGGCSELTWDFEETKTQGNCPNSYTLQRVWTARDTCGDSQTHRQNIVVSDTESPSFVEVLPIDITINQGDAIPPMANLTARDNCSANVDIHTSRTESEENGNQTITYTWTATDECGNSTQHTQRITIIKKPDIKEEKKGLYPNPIQNTFFLKGFRAVSEVKIYDKSGRLVSVFEPQNSYNISNLPIGNYILVVKSDSGLDNFKIIKK
ncbi:MAG: T9SS type A sorting domain-containing protein, partial [Flavobacteriaceae bacterium]|nr:T9SS type A sorting domain-containing protein [Flavobacteriaceae bacterium]